MAYKTEDMIKQCLEAVEEHGLMFIDEIIAFVPFSKPTFYKHKLNEVDELKELVNKNRVKTKIKLKKNWAESDNATLQVALYKLIGEPEEYTRLANARQEIDQTTKNHHTVEYKNVSKQFPDE